MDAFSLIHTFAILAILQLTLLMLTFLLLSSRTLKIMSIRGSNTTKPMKTTHKIASWLTLEQLESLSAAEMQYMNEYGLTNVVNRYKSFLVDSDIEGFWNSLHTQRGTCPTFVQTQHFRTYLTILTVLDGAGEDLITFYFQQHLREYVAWHNESATADHDAPSTIAKLISIFVED